MAHSGLAMVERAPDSGPAQSETPPLHGLSFTASLGMAALQYLKFGILLINGMLLGTRLSKEDNSDQFAYVFFIMTCSLGLQMINIALCCGGQSELPFNGIQGLMMKIMPKIDMLIEASEAVILSNSLFSHIGLHPGIGIPLSLASISSSALASHFHYDMNRLSEPEMQARWGQLKLANRAIFSLNRGLLFLSAIYEFVENYFGVHMPGTKAETGIVLLVVCLTSSGMEALAYYVERQNNDHSHEGRHPLDAIIAALTSSGMYAFFYPSLKIVGLKNIHSLAPSLSAATISLSLSGAQWAIFPKKRQYVLAYYERNGFFKTAEHRPLAGAVDSSEAHPEMALNIINQPA